jgi:protein-L-isoaspartate(D-aspartate) O-methyltransferase
MTGTSGWGAMILATLSVSGFEALTLGPCGFYPCAGARDDRLSKQVDALFLDRGRITNWRFLIRTDGAEVNLEAASQ